MAIKHRNILAAFQGWVRSKRKQRRRAITIHTLNALPLPLQRDIHWDPTHPDRQ